MIKLERIELGEIAAREYENMRKWWGGRAGSHYNRREYPDIYSKLSNPICFGVDDSNEDSRIKSYYDAILESFHHPLICGVSVNNQGVWRRARKYGALYEIYDSPPKEDIIENVQHKRKDIDKMDSDPEILEMARIAANDEFHYNYLEILLGYSGHVLKRPIISFIECKTQDRTQIIGYEVEFAWRDRDFFVTKTKKSNYNINYGLWVPDNYKGIRSPASMKKKIIFNQ